MGGGGSGRRMTVLILVSISIVQYIDIDLVYNIYVLQQLYYELLGICIINYCTVENFQGGNFCGFCESE